MRYAVIILVACVLAIGVAAKKDDGKNKPEDEDYDIMGEDGIVELMKKYNYFGGHNHKCHHHHDHYWHYLAFLALKAKFAAVVIAGIVGALVYFKYFAYAHKCHCPHYVHDHGPPEYHHDRRSRALDAKTAHILEGIEHFNTTVIRRHDKNSSCREKILCLLQNATRQYPIMQSAFRFLRDDHSNGSETYGYRNCTQLYPHCT